MNIPMGLSRQQTREYLQRQASMGRYMILGTVIVTVVNIVFLLLNGEFYITYSAALGYYLPWLGKLMDNHYLSILGPNGIYTRTGLVMGAVVLAVLLVLWWLAKADTKWLKAAIGLLVLDTAALVLLAATLFADGILSVIWDLVIHVAVIWEMGKAVSARSMLQQLPLEEPVPEAEFPVDTEEVL